MRIWGWGKSPIWQQSLQISEYSVSNMGGKCHFSATRNFLLFMRTVNFYLVSCKFLQSTPNCIIFDKQFQKIFWGENPHTGRHSPWEMIITNHLVALCAFNVQRWYSLSYPPSSPGFLWLQLAWHPAITGCQIVFFRWHLAKRVTETLEKGLPPIHI